MKNKSVDENLVYILKNTTPYQRMVWLKKAFEFWKTVQKIITADAAKRQNKL